VKWYRRFSLPSRASRPPGHVNGTFPRDYAPVAAVPASNSSVRRSRWYSSKSARIERLPFAGTARGSVYISRLKFGRAVRRLRTAADYSQESFADAIGVHRTFMGSVERGETNISLDNIARIAKGLRVTLAELFAETEKDGR